MSTTIWTSASRRQFAFLLAVATTFSFSATLRPAEPSRDVVVAGLEARQLDDKLKGLVLLDELNCVACHVSDSSLAETRKAAPRLSDVGSRVNPYYLERFIQSPQRLKPGTTMPDVMAHLEADERHSAAKTITHFLLSLNKSKPFDLQAIDTVAAERGAELFHTVGCVACHSPRDEKGNEILPETSVPLGVLEKKYNTRSLAEFLRTPHKTRPSGRMPDMRLNHADAERIAHYLLRETKVPGHLRYTLLRGRVWEGLEVNVTKEKSGHVEDFELESVPKLQGNSAIVYDGFLKVDMAGDYTFFLEWNGGELWLNDAQVANLPPSPRRGVKTTQANAKLAAGWNKIKLVYIHAGKEPRLKFEMEGLHFKRQAIPESRLSVSETPIAPYQPYQVGEAMATEGKRNFSKLGCAKCHDDIRVKSSTTPALAELDASRGCLSDAVGRWPRFQISDEQKALIRPLLPKFEPIKLDDQQVVDKSLVTFNCLACHERAGLGGVSPERDKYFVGSKTELGNQGRIPPPLTHVGAKLKTSWIKEVMLHGKQQREYLATTMPQFGEANVGHLVDLFEKVDHLEEVTFAKIDDVDAYKRGGHELIGSKGFSCIACHDFNGQKAAGPGAMEIIHSTERLKKDWFYLFMLKPARFHTNTIMPSSWPDGYVFKEHLLGGDAKKQIESIWVYLEDGTRAKNPIGLSRKSPELRVTDEAVICRGRGNAGYRGIAVGYPQRVSLAFDSQEMNLRLLWKGEFATASEGRFSARGSDRIQFAPGIPFHRLKTLDDNWPYKRKTDYQFPQDHGYQFRGYYLDKKKRPTFMYRYGEIRIEEFFEDVLDEEKVVYFRRTFTFDTPHAQEKFYFRAATATDIIEQEADKSRTTFKAGRLTVTANGNFECVVRDGEPKELLIPVELPQGKSTLVLEYRW